MLEQIRAARDEAMRLLLAAKDLGNQIREKQAKKESIGELEKQFDVVYADCQKAQQILQRLEAEHAVEMAIRESHAPADPLFPHRGRQESLDGEISERLEREGLTGTEHSRHARMRARQEKTRLERMREQYARAGVTSPALFRAFREAHAESMVPYLLQGPLAAMRVFETVGFKPAESMALLSTTGDLGGYLTSDDIQAEVLRDLAGFAVIRANARVYQTGGPALVFPTIQSATTDADVYSSGYTGAWKAEGYVTGGTAPTVQNQPKFGQARIPVHVWAPDAIEITQELLQDSMAPLEQIIAEVIAETLALDEDSAFINGNGVNKPEGLATASITAVNSGSATLVKYGGLVDLFVNLPAQYRQNAKWLMNSLTYGAILKLEDTAGNPIIPPNSTPNTLWGKPILFSELVVDIAANAFPIYFGDFRYYGIADRMELRIQRLMERFAPNIGILPMRRTGGQVLRTAAFRKQKISA